jgi:hypothetical protein
MEEEMYNDILGQPLKSLRCLQREIQEEMDLKLPAGNDNVQPQQHQKSETEFSLKGLSSNQLHKLNQMVQRAINSREQKHPEELLVEPEQPPLARLDEEQLRDNYHYLLYERDHRQKGHDNNYRPEIFEDMADISDELLEQLVNGFEAEFTRRGLGIPAYTNCKCGARGYFQFDLLEDIYPPSMRLRFFELRESRPCVAFNEVRILRAFLSKCRMPGVNVPPDLSNSDYSSNYGDPQQQDGSPPAENCN